MVDVCRMEMDCCEGRAGRQQICTLGFSLEPCDDARCQLLGQTGLQGTRTSTRVSLRVPRNMQCAAEPHALMWLRYMVPKQCCAKMWLVHDH